MLGRMTALDVISQHFGSGGGYNPGKALSSLEPALFPRHPNLINTEKITPRFWERVNWKSWYVQMKKRFWNAGILRLDLLWEALRAAPTFQKLCEEKQK
jgi:hypothetical protein